MNKKKYMSMFLLLMMIGSTFAYSVIQSLNRKENGIKVELPDINIVEYELTNEQKSYAIYQGFTLMEYEYPDNCDKCENQKNFLRSFATEFHDQVYLELLEKEYSDTPSLIIASYYGNENIDDPGEQETLDSLCELMIKPPITCASFHLNG